ncbi:hypothetical protein Adt_36789 [Abeliophyllum distichum]|uniref:Uncharacterized protein n=1 Tax=Abeliophyllum distichum TaxID=126358 RepID=A0ABD1QIV0_9LAMI
MEKKRLVIIGTPTIKSTAVEVKDNSSSLPPFVEVGNDSSSPLPKTSTSPPVAVQHQDKGEKVVTKRALEEEGDVVDSGRVKRIQMAPTQETAKSVPTSPIVVRDSLRD